MTDILNHKGYSGSIEIDLQHDCLFGKLLFINDAVIYQGKNLPELKESFKNAVDEYLDTCAEMGREPDKQFSGSFNIRIDPKMHKRLAVESIKNNKSINSLVALSIEEFLKNTESVLDVQNSDHCSHAGFG
jgi:predicted HicB family RNase H-like nuclease